VCPIFYSGMQPTQNSTLHPCYGPTLEKIIGSQLWNGIETANVDLVAVRTAILHRPLQRILPVKVRHPDKYPWQNLSSNNLIAAVPSCSIEGRE
jgi:hypothetical protein